MNWKATTTSTTGNENLSGPSKAAIRPLGSPIWFFSLFDPNSRRASKTTKKKIENGCSRASEIIPYWLLGEKGRKSRVSWLDTWFGSRGQIWSGFYQQQLDLCPWQPAHWPLDNGEELGTSSFPFTDQWCS